MFERTKRRYLGGLPPCRPDERECLLDVVGLYPVRVILAFSGEIWHWKGPAPWHFITVPDEECGALEAASARVTYGWGMIPVTAQIGKTGWTTSLFPKDGQYIVPVKASVRQAERLEVGDTVTVRLEIDV